MAYILKNTSALINTRLTDTGRLKLSQGNFNISYFQIGDSEVSYNTLPNWYSQENTNILEPNFNSQNSAPGQSNKQNVKYPFYVDENDTNTYGIPFSDPQVSPVYNSAVLRGFFSGNSSTTSPSWSAFTDNEYTINSNYVVDVSKFTGGTQITLTFSACNSSIVRLPAKGDLITIYFDGNTALCTTEPTPVTPTPTPTPTITPTPNNCIIYPTPTPSSTCCVPTPTGCTPTPVPNTFINVSSCHSILTYRIVDICLNVVTLDRSTPDYTYVTSGCSYARTLIYPPKMTDLYDSVTPLNHWSTDVINYESVCNTDEFDVKIWNMNIPWSENPAGLTNPSLGYPYFGSSSYIGTKEYLGYMSSSGQTFVDENKVVEDSVYYYDSFGDKIVVEPKEQKAIAIIHYTNQTIDFFYGEKFALEPYDPTNPQDTTGQAVNFKLHLPWLMWHKSPTCCVGETFYVSPPDFIESDTELLLKPHYIRSTKNSDMNEPGIRYYFLWDNNPSLRDKKKPNRVGKVFPDQKIIVIDDEELVAALSYKSNRNWTLPASSLSLTVPNTCNSQTPTSDGLLTGSSQTLYVSYLLNNTSSGSTNSLHCNYYSKINGPNLDCGNIGRRDVAVRFGGEFNCLNQISTNFLVNGYVADSFQIICQLVEGNGRPESDEWKIIDFTDQLSATTINGYITQSGLTGNTFVITQDLYESASTYNLNSFISLPTGTTTKKPTLNFGDEYYFYGSLETDIQATIYEMRYKINLGQAEFQKPTNPTWSSGVIPQITEIGLYDSDFNLMIVSKLQSPVPRQGIQQFLVKFDF